MPVAKDGSLTTISVVVSKRLNAAIRGEHARRVAAYEAEHGSRRGAPTLSKVWEDYAWAGLSSAHDGNIVTNADVEAA